MFLAYLAANAESVARDKKTLFVNAFWVVNFMSLYHARKRTYAGIFTGLARAAQLWLGPLITFLLTLFALHWIADRYLSVVKAAPDWLWIWIAVGIPIAFVQSTYGLIMLQTNARFKATEGQGTQSERALDALHHAFPYSDDARFMVFVNAALAYTDWIINLRKKHPFWSAAYRLLTYAVSGPGTLVFFSCLLIFSASAAMSVLLVIALCVVLSPFIAWRTLFLTTGPLFILMVGNSAVVHHVIAI
jgi:hypothetical protein